ncbi:hypothetical protein OLO86_01300 [Campylobacter jejuni]|nr:hypothetical protein [Campylobacter jejuni]
MSKRCKNHHLRSTHTRKKGTYADLLENLRNKGYVRAQIDGVLVRLDEEIELAKTKKHTIKLVIDRLEFKKIYFLVLQAI